MNVSNNLDPCCLIRATWEENRLKLLIFNVFTLHIFLF